MTSACVCVISALSFYPRALSRFCQRFYLNLWHLLVLSDGCFTFFSRGPSVSTRDSQTILETLETWQCQVDVLSHFSDMVPRRNLWERASEAELPPLSSNPWNKNVKLTFFEQMTQKIEAIFRYTLIKFQRDERLLCKSWLKISKASTFLFHQFEERGGTISEKSRIVVGILVQSASSIINLCILIVSMGWILEAAAFLAHLRSDFVFLQPFLFLHERCHDKSFRLLPWSRLSFGFYMNSFFSAGRVSAPDLRNFSPRKADEWSIDIVSCGERLGIWENPIGISDNFKCHNWGEGMLVTYQW
jgi:hypothetical protein